ncbi:MAG TPA: phosphotransferase [Streptosporangiaceae bacterium]|jgi:hypothetical protein
MESSAQEEAVGAVRALLPAARIEPVEWLRRTDRSAVLRVRAEGAGWPGPQALIVKLFPDAGEAWARESAALIAAPASAPVPDLIAAGADPPLVVMTDAGSGSSLADVLLARDATAAGTAVEEFATALARLHLSTSGQETRRAFAAELATRSGGTAAESVMPGYADRAVRDLAALCDQLEVPVPDGALAGLAEIPDRLGPDGPAALTLADACPDNSVRQGAGYVLIDFEEAQWRHIAWDAAYLTVPWPACWCAYALPAEVARRGVARYRAALADELPYAATSAFEHDLALATIAWDLISASWFLAAALIKEARFQNGTGSSVDAPTGRAVIMHHLGDASRSSVSPPLAELARRLHGELVRRWGEVPLALAPAWDQAKPRESDEQATAKFSR